ncbi:MAG: transposase [Deltaproteobacteria bacterium]|nr:MAG: transposase [Deltaproteobacteria bacterium]
MPRKARIDAPGALHHIIVRGIERRRIFYDDQDRDNFIRRLGDIITDTETFCFAWTLIPNHLHLVLRTGKTSISTVMSRLLTGHAVYYNRRHRRHGQLYQNRFKSILCQEDTYLLELVRYSHLNSMRAKLVKDLKELDKYPYSGHSAIMAKKQRNFQDVEYVLRFFGKKVIAARRAYRRFVNKGITQGRRPDLVGGGLVRSAGGWSALIAMRRDQVRMKGDERILGDGEFTQSVLDLAKERVEQRYRLKAQGYNLDKVTLRVANVLGMEPSQIWAPGKNPKTVKARSLLCYWAVRQLGFSATELSKRLGISQPSVSISVKRGETIAKAERLNLVDD